MIKIKFTNYLKNRIKQRNFKKSFVFNLFNSSTSIFYDNLNRTYIKISKFNQKLYMIAYIQKDDQIKIITIHIIKHTQIVNRIKNKRWSIIKNKSNYDNWS